MYIFNSPERKQRRRYLRNVAPKAEILLWSQLKNSQFLNLKFRRQYGVGPYVIDFYCAKYRLAIEVDGPSHFEGDADKYDKDRQECIEQFGIRFLRFTNDEIYENLEGVLANIQHFLGL